MVWYGMVWFVWKSMVWYGSARLVSCGTVWYGIVWYAGRVEGLPAEALQPLLLPLNLHILYHIFLQTQFCDPNKNI